MLQWSAIWPVTRDQREGIDILEPQDDGEASNEGELPACHPDRRSRLVGNEVRDLHTPVAWILHPRVAGVWDDEPVLSRTGRVLQVRKVY